jgi:hypothetical protein
LALSGCAGRDDAASSASEPKVALTCIAVMPVQPAMDYEGEVSAADAKQLQDGAHLLDNLLQEALQRQDNVRFIRQGQLGGGTGESKESLAEARRLAGQLSCNALMETTISRYSDRVGGEYSAEQPAAVSFAYRVYEVDQGRVLCQGRFDEKQQSVMENLLHFSKASGRGFTWITAEALLREGLKEKLGQCSYFTDK